MDAFSTIINKNPLPHITGYICDHKCQANCTRWDYDDPLKIREIKKIAAKEGMAEYLKNLPSNRARKRSKNKIAVIGAGPAGLSAAFFLAREGLDVTIFEKLTAAGGVVGHIIPEFRIPEDIITADIDFIQRHGVKFEYGSEKNFSIKKLRANGFKYVFIAVGAEKAQKLNLSETNEPIYNAVEFLRLIHENKPVKTGREYRRNRRRKFRHGRG